MSKKKITDDLEDCYYKMAIIVRDFGDSYLPIFERLHKEIEDRDSNRSLKTIAVNIAREYDKKQ